MKRDSSTVGTTESVAQGARKAGSTGATTPWPLLLYDRCQRYGALPEAGGLLDQDEVLLDLMDTCVTYAKLGLMPFKKMTSTQRRMLVELKKAERDED